MKKLTRARRIARQMALALAWLLLAASTTRADEPAAETRVHGRLSTHHGLPVLELWGTPEQAGYAHGYLLAEHIVRLIDAYVLDEKIVPNTGLYETVLLPGVRRQFDWPDDRERELQALCRGVRDRLGPDGFRSCKLGRRLTLEDAMVANALADWFGARCSTFSAWGSLTEDGRTLTARNLDFPSAGGMDQAQLVLVYRGDGRRRPWIGVTWPGMIGVYTAMNAEGVTILMHDARGLPASRAAGFTPRALILREALEAAAADTLVEDVQSVLEHRAVMVGNNIHVSGPWRANEPPAVVFEYDGNERDNGVTPRLPEANGGQLADMLSCTNHMRLRRAPVECRRFTKLENELTALAAAGEKLDAARAMELIHLVRQRTTLHSVVVRPDRHVIHVQIPAVSDELVEFRLDDWLKRPVGEAALAPAATGRPAPNRAEDRP